MTKIGEGNQPPKQPSVEQYHKEIEQNAAKFLNALESYQTADSNDRIHLKGIMDQSLALIRASVQEIKQKGIYKQEIKVEKDYQAYINSGTSESRSALEEDLSTLRDLNNLKG